MGGCDVWMGGGGGLGARFLLLAGGCWRRWSEEVEEEGEEGR